MQQLLPKLPPFSGSLPWDPRVGFSEGLMGREHLLWAGDLLRSAGPPSQTPSYSTLGSHKSQSFYHGLEYLPWGWAVMKGVTEAWPWFSLLRGLQRRNCNAVWCPMYTHDTKDSYYTFQGLGHPHPTAWLLCSLLFLPLLYPELFGSHPFSSHNLHLACPCFAPLLDSHSPEATRLPCKPH